MTGEPPDTQQTIRCVKCGGDFSPLDIDNPETHPCKAELPSRLDGEPVPYTPEREVKVEP